MDKTQVEHQADKLDAVLKDPNYRETIGAWLEEQRVLALRQFAANTELTEREMYRWQGTFRTIDAMQFWIKSVLDRAEAARKKRIKIDEKKANKESV